ncbi:alpha/beta hydrolase family protein [Phyllobacterium zundukense]|uniref:Uncharacterized protein n=1 Tax=Phyllobacterium zundukense TaxID=1867719 RepID=A0ACD4D9R8_9HYPH|nr:hypothetical protein [Phyllobacterium zundukense]UXN62499.1 hypothetical protein N8E88_21260 [Phyllobacterium zundukense]
MPAEVFFRIFPSSTSLNYLIFGLSAIRGYSLSVIPGLDPRTHGNFQIAALNSCFDTKCGSFGSSPGITEREGFCALKSPTKQIGTIIAYMIDAGCTSRIHIIIRQLIFLSFHGRLFSECDLQLKELFTMTQWLKPHTRLACRLAQTACISALLVGALSGCNEDKTPTAGSTFDVPPVQTAVTADIPKDEPVKGTVTVVPGTEPDTQPQTGGGLAIPLATKVGRFTEIAPDTAGGATFSSTPAYVYDLGNLVSKSNGTDVISTKDDSIFIAPIRGWVRYPREAISLLAPKSRYPIIVFEHGMGASQSYMGYDYLAEELATHGYVVLSIDADTNNNMGDRTSQSRGQLILGTLDLLRQIDMNGQIDKDGKPGALDLLKGKLDFDRIGIMGHSRGGQGVSNAIKYNQTRVGVSVDDLKDVLMANPTAWAFIKYPDLAAAVTPASTQPAVEATPAKVVPASIDEEKFEVTYERYRGSLLGGMLTGDAEAVKALLIAGHFPLRELFPDLAATVIPATTQPAVEGKPAKAVPASIDDPKLKAAAEKYSLSYAAGRETALPYDFKAAFMLAPTNADSNLGLTNVPLANLLPSCDGDVTNLEGARSYDNNRYGPQTDSAPRYQIFVKGANHDFYNRKWGDDGEAANAAYCDDGRKDSVRLSRPNQERNGLFLINSFMRYHVGGEQKFAAYWNGTAQLPEAACEEDKKTCDERTVLTVQKGDYRRKLIQRFAQADSLKRNQLGGAVTYSGFDDNGLVRCNMPIGPANGSWVYERTKCFDVGGKSSDALKDFAYPLGWWSHSNPDGARGIGFLSIADHAELAWSKPNATIITDLAGLSTKGVDSLTFRIAVVWPMGQEVLVSMTDSTGKTATVTASDYSDALYNTLALKAVSGPKKDDPSKDIPMTDRTDDALWAKSVPQLLNMVAIPLAAFEGIDTTSLKELKLVFPKGSGKVAITDIELQNLGRDKPAQKLARQ